jgi:ubiquinone/menaquinone biosynthesis C-methylase UbiE
MKQNHNKRPIRRRSSFELLGIFAALLSVNCHSPSSTPTSPSGEKSVRPGINDAYKDTDVARWIERFEREDREVFIQRRAISDALDLRPGMIVADIGAGTGFFSEIFAERIGPSGIVQAVDIKPEFLTHIKKRAKLLGFQNIRTVLSREDSIELPADSVDLAFLCDTYHHFEYPKSSLASIWRALRPGGRLVVIDFKKIPGESREWVLDHVRAGEEAVAKEIGSAGFVLRSDWPEKAILDENYMLLFVKTP